MTQAVTCIILAYKFFKSNFEIMKSKLHWSTWLVIGMVGLLVVSTLFTKKDNENKISFSMPKLASKTETKTQ